MASPIKLIALDIDGTLQNSRHELSARNVLALRAAVEQGVRVVLATGKTRTACLPILARCGLNMPLICMEGTIIYQPEGTIRQQHVLDIAIARQVITFAEDRGYLLLANSGERILMRAPDARADKLLAQYNEPPAEAVGPLQNLLDALPVNKLLAFKADHSIKPLQWQLKMQFNGALKLTPVMLDSALQIMPAAASKGAALKLLMKDLKLRPEQVLAIGDAENDLEMFAAAGSSVAMGNARPAVKAAAKHTTASNDEDGVAQALERFVLQSPHNQPMPVETETIP